MVLESVLLVPSLGPLVAFIPVQVLYSSCTYRCNVLLDPLQALDLVLETVVQAPVVHNLSALQETERANSVVDLDDHDATERSQLAAVEVGIGVGLEAAALDEVQNRQFRLRRSVGRSKDVGK